MVMMNQEILAIDCDAFIAEREAAGETVDEKFDAGVNKLKWGCLNDAFVDFVACNMDVMHHAYAAAFCYATGIGCIADCELAEKLLRKFVTDDAPACVWNVYGLIIDELDGGSAALPYYMAASRKGYGIASYNIARITTKYKLYMLLRANLQGVTGLWSTIGDIHNDKNSMYYNPALAYYCYTLAGRYTTAKEIMSAFTDVERTRARRVFIYGPNYHGWKFDDTDNIYGDLISYVEDGEPADKHIKRQQAEDEAAAASAAALADTAAKTSEDNASETVDESAEIIDDELADRAYNIWTTSLLHGVMDSRGPFGEIDVKIEAKHAAIRMASDLKHIKEEAEKSASFVKSAEVVFKETFKKAVKEEQDIKKKAQVVNSQVADSSVEPVKPSVDDAKTAIMELPEKERGELIRELLMTLINTKP